jgi:hypothetical protein
MSVEPDLYPVFETENIRLRNCELSFTHEFIDAMMKCAGLSWRDILSLVHKRTLFAK